MNEEMVTVAEIAASLRISKMTVYRWIHAGHIPAHRVGRVYRVSRKDAQEFWDQSVYVPNDNS